VPVHARQLAARLSTLFNRDVQIVKRLNDAHHRLQQASERLCSGPAPDGFGLTNDNTAAAIGQNPIATLIHDGGPIATSQLLEALKQAQWQIHRSFCQYQSASEERRQLAFDVGELSQQLTQALSAAGWSADQTRNANVHQLAGATT
jgi:hypothetical protein